MSSLRHRLLKLSASLTGPLVPLDLRYVKVLRLLLDTSACVLLPPWGTSVQRVQAGQVGAEWLHPAHSSRTKVLLYLHGGGYVCGSPQTHRGLAARIAQEAGICALLPQYRLAPEHPYPAALEDALSAYEYLLSEGFLAKDIVVAGDSAGGGLCMALLLHLRDQRQPLPAACVCLSPWVDMSFQGSDVQTLMRRDPIVQVPRIRSWAAAYAGEHSPDAPLLSPLFAPLEGLPPIWIQASNAEVLSDDARRLTERLRETGNIVQLDMWEDMLHVWQILWRFLPEAEKSIQKTGIFIRQMLFPAL